jgi:hypothetical protein
MALDLKINGLSIDGSAEGFRCLVIGVHTYESLVLSCDGILSKGLSLYLLGQSRNHVYNSLRQIPRILKQNTDCQLVVLMYHQYKNITSEYDSIVINDNVDVAISDNIGGIVPYQESFPSHQSVYTPWYTVVCIHAFDTRLKPLSLDVEKFRYLRYFN